MSVEYEAVTHPVCRAVSDACRNLLPPPEINVSGSILTKRYIEFAQKIRDLEVRPDDTWVISFPKCGTTWTQEMVWLLGNNLDFETAKAQELKFRFLYLEVTTLMPKVIDEKLYHADSLKRVNEMKSPRFIKTHLPLQLLPMQLFQVNPKIIYVTRNPKDAAISYYYHFRLWNDYKGSLELFLESYVQDLALYSPYWEHVLRFWYMRHQDNLLFLFYEDLKKDLATEIKRTANFLGVSYTKNEEQMLFNHLQFESMKKNFCVNYENSIKTLGVNGLFIRQGLSGVWRREMSPEISRKFDEWTEEKTKGTDFPLEKYY